MVFSLTANAAVSRECPPRARGRAAAASMKLLFEPRVVAVLGASRERGKIGAEILFNLVSNGFQGTVVPINPNAGEILGLPC
jgi:acyl-CoA synthetase (NDP forming)